MSVIGRAKDRIATQGRLSVGPIDRPVDDPWVRYTLQAVRGGLVTSIFLILVVVVYLSISAHAGFNMVGITVLIAASSGLTIVVALLPWQRMTDRPVGDWTIYGWAMTMMGVIDLAIAFTGGAHSQLYLALIVAAVFLAGPAYPPFLEVGLTAVTISGYILTLVVTGWGITTATLVLRVGMIVAAALAVGVLNHELSRAFRLQKTEREAAEGRAAMWSHMAAVVREIDAPDVARVLAAVVGALDALGFECSDICAIDPDRSTYRVVHASNLSAEYVSRHHDASIGMVGQVLATRSTVVTNHYAGQITGVTGLHGNNLRTVICAPVWVDGVLHGVLEAGTAKPRSLRAEEIGAFEMLAAQAGHALENALLLERQRLDRDRFRQLLESAPDAVVVAQAATGKILEVSNQAEHLFGYAAEELIGQPAQILVPERVRTRQFSMVDSWLEGGASVIGTDRTVYLLRKDGTEIPVEVTFSRLDAPEGDVISAAVRDITERREFERRLAYQATHDRLTQLPNRELFTQRLARSLHGRLTGDSPVTVCLLDLDHFKYLNDSRGHRVGDLLVTAVAERLGLLLDGDFIARVGGDEFGLLVEGPASVSEARAFGERLLAAFQKPFELDSIDTYATASVGIAFGRSSDGAEVVLSNADAAVNRAKQNGRDRIELFDESLTIAAADRVATEAQLHLALDRGELTLAYQPVVALIDDRLVGLEALLRWQHPVRGVVPPCQFIPTAEETGLIVPIGRWVLNEACRQLATWRARYPDRPSFSVSVNVSSRQLEHDQFVTDVAEALSETGIPPYLLVLEITESFFIRDFHAAVRRLHGLKELGVRLAIDDFGTGFSSLFSLSRLPVDIVKIDKAFIDGLGSRYDAVVTAVVTMGRAFDLDVVAEGIEEEEQRDRLVNLGCRYAQGYYFSRPLGLEAADLLLRPLSIPTESVALRGVSPHDPLHREPGPITITP